MSRTARRFLSGFLVLACLALPARAHGWSLLHGHKDCPPHSYCCLHYWTPMGVRCFEKCFGPKLGVYAPERFPCIPPRDRIMEYPCRAVPPGAWPYGASH